MGQQSLTLRQTTKFSMLYMSLLVQPTNYKFDNFVDIISHFDIWILLLCSVCCVTVNNPSRTGAGSFHILIYTQSFSSMNMYKPKLADVDPCVFAVGST